MCDNFIVYLVDSTKHIKHIICFSIWENHYFSCISFQNFPSKCFFKLFLQCSPSKFSIPIFFKMFLRNFPSKCSFKLFLQNFSYKFSLYLRWLMALQISFRTCLQIFQARPKVFSTTMLTIMNSRCFHKWTIFKTNLALSGWWVKWTLTRHCTI